MAWRGVGGVAWRGVVLVVMTTRGVARPRGRGRLVCVPGARRLTAVQVKFKFARLRHSTAGEVQILASAAQLQVKFKCFVGRAAAA